MQILDENPLTDFVELPESCHNLSFCNILCGVIRGAMEQVGVTGGLELPAVLYKPALKDACSCMHMGV